MSYQKSLFLAALLMFVASLFNLLWSERRASSNEIPLHARLRDLDHLADDFGHGQK